jgi:predicted DNA-binding transcriptional regulator AlpA
MEMIASETGLIKESEAAALLSVTVKCLQAWRMRGGGPRYVGISGRCVRYRRADLDAWAESKLRSSTSDLGKAVI